MAAYTIKHKLGDFNACVCGFGHFSVSVNLNGNRNICFRTQHRMPFEVNWFCKMCDTLN